MPLAGGPPRPTESPEAVGTRPAPGPIPVGPLAQPTEPTPPAAPAEPQAAGRQEMEFDMADKPEHIAAIRPIPVPGPSPIGQPEIHQPIAPTPALAPSEPAGVPAGPSNVTPSVAPSQGTAAVEPGAVAPSAVPSESAGPSEPAAAPAGPIPEPAPVIQPVSPERQAAAKEAFEQAVKLQAAGKSAEAEELYKQAVEQDPNLVQALVNLAGLRLLAKDYLAAEMSYTQALAVEPSRTSALFGLARAQMLRGNAYGAHGTLAKLLTLSPDDATAWVLFGDASWTLGSRDQAREAWSKAAAKAPAGSPVARAAEQRLARNK